MPQFLRVRGWNEFQHYKDRDPPWIKLHRKLLTSQTWVALDDASRALAIALMLLAAGTDNKIPADKGYLKRVAYLNSDPDWEPLVRTQFVEVISDSGQVLADASNTLANGTKCSPETEKRRDREEEREKTRARDSLASASESLAEAPRGTDHALPTTMLPDRKPTGISVEAAYASLLDDWRRDVPEVNAVAFQKWIVHVESKGRPMNTAMRLAQARRLASYGTHAEQLEIVNYCADEKGYASLMPLDDVRVRTQGLSRNRDSKGRPPAPTEAESLQKLKDGRAAAGLGDFRDPLPGETSKQYWKALNDEWKRRDQEKNSAPRFGATVAAPAAAKRVGT